MPRESRTSSRRMSGCGVWKAGVSKPGTCAPHSTMDCVRSSITPDRSSIGTAIGSLYPLIDTFLDEKFEVLNVAEAMGKKLFAVRFDTPGSRRGNFFRILEEVRWELDLRGFKDVKFFVSGGINEQDIPVLNPVVQGYGVGTSISNAPVIDFGMDIVEIDGKPIAKRGKWSGSKRMLACAMCGERKIAPNDVYGSTCSCGGVLNDLLVPLLDHGQQLVEPESPARIREMVLMHVNGLEAPV